MMYCTNFTVEKECRQKGGYIDQNWNNLLFTWSFLIMMLSMHYTPLLSYNFPNDETTKNLTPIK